MSDWKRQPLLHFLVFGMILFALGMIFGGRQDAPGNPTVAVTKRTVDRLSQTWESRWHRAPSEEELEALIAGYVREEILYRSAKEMGLGEDDPVIRQRLLEKIGYLSQVGALPQEPSEEELEEYFTNNPDLFAVPARRTFTHIYFSTEERGQRAWQDAEAVLGQLSAMSPGPRRAPELGDRFAMQYDYRNRSESEVARHMGPDFAGRLFALADDDWAGPLRSAYGVHLVRVLDRSEAKPLDYSEVRDRVREELMAERRERAAEAFYEELRSRYEIVEGDDS